MSWNDKPRSRREFEEKQRHIRANRNARHAVWAKHLDARINQAAARPLEVDTSAPDVAAARDGLQAAALRRLDRLRRGS